MVPAGVGGELVEPESEGPLASPWRGCAALGAAAIAKPAIEAHSQAARCMTQV
jgi:hypothetical protein